MSKRSQKRTRKSARCPSRRPRITPLHKAPVFDGVTPLEPRLLLSGDMGSAFSALVYDMDSSTTWGRPGEGWQVYVDLNENGQLDAEEPTQVTDKNGRFVFRDLAKGDYIVRAIERDGFKIENNAQKVRIYPGLDVMPGNPIVVTPDGSISPHEIVALKTPVIEGTLYTSDKFAANVMGMGWKVYVDLNENGQLDPDEPNILTGSMGEYAFYDLPDGEYTVRAVLYDGYIASGPVLRQTVADGQHTQGVLYVLKNEIPVEDVSVDSAETEPVPQTSYNPSSSETPAGGGDNISIYTGSFTKPIDSIPLPSLTDILNFHDWWDQNKDNLDVPQDFMGKVDAKLWRAFELVEHAPEGYYDHLGGVYAGDDLAFTEGGGNNYDDRYDVSGKALLVAVYTTPDKDAFWKAYNEVKAMGIETGYANEQGYYFSVLIRQDDLATIAALDSIIVMKGSPASPIIYNTGSALTQGDAGHNADDLRNTFSLDGTGIKVGVISDGIGDISSSQASLDLPSITPHPTLQGLSNRNEGTALLEIIHDLAPGAELYFVGLSNVIGTVSDLSSAMITGIDWLVSQGCSIIVDDVGLPWEPYFQDNATGSLAEKVQDVVATSNVTYITAAGNFGNDLGVAKPNHYQSEYHNSGGSHDFDPGSGVDTNRRMEIPALSTMQVWLQWSDPFGSVASDYTATITGSSTEHSLRLAGWTTNPVEIVTYENNNPYPIIYVDMSVSRVSGTAERFEIFAFSCAAQEYITREDSYMGQQLAEDAIVVTAVDQNGEVRYYASRGQATLYSNFATQDVYLRDVIDIAARDGVDTAATGYTYFDGTSAAAPHIAGIAALWKQFKPNMSSDRLAQVLRDSAVDLGDAGFDPTYGAGKADAFQIYQISTLPDFNKDGHADLAWVDYTHNTNVVWFLNNGSKDGVGGYFSATPPSAWKLDGYGDFNRDGNIDLFWHNYGTDEKIVWYMDGTYKIGASPVVGGSSG
ncbi:MAG: S8 family serine peptidase [Phycisphaera sp.]|nr:S8 family serine peptidase [Phycisphaera sp.]